MIGAVKVEVGSPPAEAVEAVSSLLEAFAAVRHDTCVRMAQAICERIPEYAVAYEADALVLACACATGLFVRVAQGHPIAPAEMSRMRSMAAEGARDGVSLESAQEAIRVARTAMSDALVRLLGGWWNPAEGLRALDLVERALIDFVEQLSNELADAYSSVARLDSSARSRALERLYESILTGSDAELGKAGPLLDLRAPHSLYLASAPPDSEQVDALAAELGRLPRTVVVAPGHGGALALVVDAGSQTWHRDATAIACDRGSVILAAGPCCDADELRARYRRSATLLAAAQVIARGRPLVHLSELRPYELVASMPSSVRESLIGEVLGKLLALPTVRRGPLLDTVGVLVDDAAGPTMAAQLLGVDRKTIDRRLGQLEALTNLALDRPGDRDVLAAAFRSYALGDSSVERQGP